MGRVIVLVLDSVGVGEAHDAALYGDAGANTLRHIARAAGELSLPYLGSLGLGHMVSLPGVPPEPYPRGCWRVLQPAAPGKDTTTGHWELAGLILDRPFPLYPRGFPPDIIAALERVAGRKVLGNRTASGTEIIHELGPEHLDTGRIIVYTSADSVFQVAAHEEVVPLEELYRICRYAREILQGEHGVARVIARPFSGTPGAFRRTGGRKDFSLSPPGKTVLDSLRQQGLGVTGVGKIGDIFAGQGLDRSLPTSGNQDGMRQVLQVLEEEKGGGLVLVNLVDFDTEYGHRNDVRGYAAALEECDAWLPQLERALLPHDVVLLTADHGCDPTFPGTDHTRERVPLLAFGPGVRPGQALGTGATLADVAATVSGILQVPWSGPGASQAGALLGQQVRSQNPKSELGGESRG